MFAGVARHYDLLNHLLSLNIDKRWRRFTVHKVPPRPGLPTLDVCTGTADLALGYAAAAKGASRVVGTDFCHEMLALASQKCRQQGADVALIEADTQRLPFADDVFGIVAVAFGLRNVSNTRAGLAEMIRVAHPGGRIVILEFSRPRVPILGWCYLAYFKYLLPCLGQLVSRSPHAAYRYLPASVLEFPDGQEMCALLQEMGLQQVEHHRLTLGIATLYVGHKPSTRRSGNE